MLNEIKSAYGGLKQSGNPETSGLNKILLILLTVSCSLLTVEAQSQFQRAVDGIDVDAANSQTDNSGELSNGAFDLSAGKVITKVDLSSSDCEEIPPVVFKMKNLRILILGDDCVKLPMEIRKLRNLRVLTIGNGVDEIPEELEQLHFLKELYLPYEKWQYEVHEVKKLTRAKIILY